MSSRLRRRSATASGASPFLAQFGHPPTLALVGREWLVEQITDSMFAQHSESDQYQNVNYQGPESFILYGPRGIGKTATLLSVCNEARSEGSIPFYVQVRKGNRFAPFLQKSAMSALESLELTTPERKWKKGIEINLLSSQS